MSMYIYIDNMYTYRVISSGFAQWMQFRLAAKLPLESAKPAWAFSSSRILPKWSGGKVGGLVKFSFETISPFLGISRYVNFAFK